jgi:hypothetical protein
MFIKNIVVAITTMLIGFTCHVTTCKNRTPTMTVQVNQHQRAGNAALHHTTIDLISGCDPEKIRSADQLNTFVIDLCCFLDATYQSPAITHLASGFIALGAINRGYIVVKAYNQYNSITIDLMLTEPHDAHALAEMSKKFFESH